jgi:hypothetical protein
VGRGFVLRIVERGIFVERHLIEKICYRAAAGVVLSCFRYRGERAESRIEDDLFDGFGGWCGCAAGIAGQVDAGYLETVEQEACAARVDVVGGYALEDLADGRLDGGAVFGQREVEG